jgi:crotonobetainyl-CoA:carnitine CoA-transferase CaiB-like acyl-CoA transferase
MVKKDAAEESWYAPAAAELSALDRKAEAAFKAGNQDEAAALIAKGQPILGRLLSARRPTLEAMEAVSDLDQLYGEMLMTNHSCGWATQFYQKNVARWKRWTPETPEATIRLKQARSGIAECERRMLQ